MKIQTKILLGLVILTPFTLSESLPIKQTEPSMLPSEVVEQIIEKSEQIMEDNRALRKKIDRLQASTNCS